MSLEIAQFFERLVTIGLWTRPSHSSFKMVLLDMAIRQGFIGKLHAALEASVATGVIFRITSAFFQHGI